MGNIGCQGRMLCCCTGPRLLDSRACGASSSAVNFIRNRFSVQEFFGLRGRGPPLSSWMKARARAKHRPSTRTRIRRSRCSGSPHWQPSGSHVWEPIPRTCPAGPRTESTETASEMQLARMPLMPRPRPFFKRALAAAAPAATACTRWPRTSAWKAGP